MEKLKFLVSFLKKLMSNKQYAISRTDVDRTLFEGLEEVCSLLEKKEQPITIKFAKLSPEATIPKKANPGDAGLDLTAVAMKLVREGNIEYYDYDLGLAVEIPEGHVGYLFPRSSITKTDLMLSNAVGVIDSGYRGRLSARFRKTNSNSPTTYRVGDRVVQLIVMPIPSIVVKEGKAEDLTSSVRGQGGFGSTGK